MKNLVIKYLRQNQYNNKVDNFEDSFLSHPNYPSLFAITDSFNLLSIENVAIKIAKEQIIELPNNFLAFYNNDLVLVNKTTEAIQIETTKSEKKNLNYNDFLEFWNGIVIAIEPNVNLTIKTKNNPKWLLYTLPFFALIALSVYFNKYSFVNFGSLLISLAGLIISIFILQEKFGVKNEIATRFCNINPNSSCNSVITSNNKINNYLNFADLPLLFFGISALAILIQPLHSCYVIGAISLLSIPIILYSVWLQKFKIKKWCVLCLVVGFLIVLQSLVFVFATTSLFVITQINFSAILFATIIISSFWFYIKPILEAKFSLEKSNIELKKFKRDFKVFSFLSEKIIEIDGFNTLEGIVFGDKNASTQLTIILSPSCGHCHKAFKDAYELFQKFPEKFYLNILFNINPENNDNPYKVIIESLLVINQHDAVKAQEAIIDWHINKLELEQWKNKWVVNVLDMSVNLQIHNQYSWCLKNEFNYTPIKIINNRLFPNGYEINELKYFINNFSEEIEHQDTLEVV